MISSAKEMYFCRRNVNIFPHPNICVPPQILLGVVHKSHIFPHLPPTGGACLVLAPAPLYGELWPSRHYTYVLQLHRIIISRLIFNCNQCGHETKQTKKFTNHIHLDTALHVHFHFWLFCRIEDKAMEN